MGHNQSDNLGHASKPDSPTASFSVSDGMEQLLGELNLTLAATSYQSGRLYMLGCHPINGLVLSEEYFRSAMGLHVEGEDLFMLSDQHLIHLRNAEHNPDAIRSYEPHQIYRTGDVNGHDLAMTETGHPIFVNTRYNCLAMLSESEDFVPVWAPSFLNGAQKGDRCHLNGLAIEDGSSAYVTGLARTCRVDGWRKERLRGGFVMDVRSNKVVCGGLSMPHSPRLFNGDLWVCNSGTGDLGIVDLTTGRFEPQVFCHGFIRGLAFHDKYAFVGLSRPRHTRFEGLPLHGRLEMDSLEPWTGVQIIDLETMETVGWFRIDGPVTELYDVAVLPGVSCAIVNGLVPSIYSDAPSNSALAPEMAITA